MTLAFSLLIEFSNHSHLIEKLLHPVCSDGSNIGQQTNMVMHMSSLNESRFVVCHNLRCDGAERNNDRNNAMDNVVYHLPVTEI